MTFKIIIFLNGLWLFTTATVIQYILKEKNRKNKMMYVKINKLYRCLEIKCFKILKIEACQKNRNRYTLEDTFREASNFYVLNKQITSLAYRFLPAHMKNEPNRSY